MAAMRPAPAGHQVRIQFRYACRPGKARENHSLKPETKAGFRMAGFLFL
jgi:hypothetical protein